MSPVGIYIINLKRTWEKLLLAARAIVAIENPADVSVISSRNTGQVWAFFAGDKAFIPGSRTLLPCVMACQWQLDDKSGKFKLWH